MIVRKSEFNGYTWQPTGGRAYNIQPEQIMPSRIRQKILDTHQLNPKLALTYRYYFYDKTNKLLFLSDTHII